MKKGLRITIIVALLLGLAVLAVLFVERRGGAAPSYKIDPARISALRGMASLCALELHEEMLLRDSVDGKWIVAREKVEGRVTFDLEQMRLERRADTLTIWLPREKVELRENAGPDSYEVLDAWDSSSRLIGRTLSATEENRLKDRWSRTIEGRLRSRGQIDRARRNAVETVRRVASTWPEASDSTLVVEVKGEWE